ncbi:helix-turn-helix domain-containing protein [Microvirga flavescens]|uniref:helix-turn-helix domain-containing protein n=1 Tax=Microvirga flavescens TaxID=2249811 RepID=UPI0018E0C12C|nr:helix-turn-helix domain-containing protein [Microvirga flavescens]
MSYESEQLDQRLRPASASEGAAQTPFPGDRIKTLRQARGMSLKELSEQAGVSTGTLSQIERNIANPSLKVITKIQAALGTTVSTLFPNVPSRHDDPDFIRRKDRRPFCDLGHLTKELISTGTSKNLEIMILHIPPYGSTGDAPLSSLSDKAGLVLEGEVELEVKGRKCDLFEGDSFLFDGCEPHAVRNKTGSPAKVLWIVSRIPLDRHI